MKHLFCDCCGDQVKVVHPCKFVYPDGLTVDFNICLDCMEEGELKINLSRKRQAAKIIKKLGNPRKL